MSSLVYLKSKNGDTVYVYVNEKGEDGRYHRRCIGHLDPITGEVLENKKKEHRTEAKVRSYGVNLLLGRISDSIGLTESLQVVFKDSWDSVLSFAFYCLTEGSLLTDMGRWMEFNETPRMWPLTPDEIKDILRDITQESIDSFFRVWNKMCGNTGYMLTALSIGRPANKVARADYDGLFSTEIEVCYGIGTGIPVAYHIQPTPYRTVHDMVSSATWDDWMDNDRTSYLIEREQAGEFGWEQILNIDNQYIVSFSKDDPMFRKMLNQYCRDRVLNSSQVKTFRYNFRGKRVFLHTFFNPMDAELETSRFLLAMDRCRMELESKNYEVSHAPFYNKYFITTDRNKIEMNSEAIMRHNQAAGYQIVMSNSFDDPAETMRWMRRNDYCRKMFNSVRNPDELTAMKLFVETNMRSRMFIQFLATILGSKLTDMISRSGLNETVDSVLLQMKELIRVNIDSRRKPIMAEPNEHQRSILDMLLTSV